MPRNAIWEGFQVEQAHRERDRQNYARRAYCELRYGTFGSGEFTTPEPLRFQQPFLMEPQFTSGLRMVVAPNREYFHFPLVQVGVTSWLMNSRKFFLGANMFFHVHIDVRAGVNPILALNPSCMITHYLTFSGVAYKSLGSRVQAQVSADPTLSTRTTDL